MSYVDGFLLVVPKKNIAAYRRMAAAAGKVWKKYGALEYRECVGDDLDVPKVMTSFRKRVQLKAGETVVFSWIVYPSRAVRDRVNAKVMADPVIAKMMTQKPPFDVKRMSMGGFKPIVEM